MTRDKERIAQTVANVLMFRSRQLPDELVRKIGEMVVEALPDTEHYIDLNSEWIYRGDRIYEHRTTHEIRRY